MLVCAAGGTRPHDRTDGDARTRHPRTHLDRRRPAAASASSAWKASCSSACPRTGQHLTAIGSAPATPPGHRARLKRVPQPDAGPAWRSSTTSFADRGGKATVLLCGVRRDLYKGAFAPSGWQRDSDRIAFFAEVAGVAWSSTLDAVRAPYELLGGDVCSNCPRGRTRERRKGGTT